MYCSAELLFSVVSFLRGSLSHLEQASGLQQAQKTDKGMGNKPMCYSEFPGAPVLSTQDGRPYTECNWVLVFWDQLPLTVRQ